ncbi:MAG: hypothetical protein KDG55_06135 [Rhodocyclaceae bacterium]|nr:hypothetical protein [Rhodocyclaceae bacterium]
MTDATGAALVLTNRLEDCSGAGLPNLLSWQLGGLRPGTEYRVQVEGVRVDGVVRNLDYAFELQ